MEKFLKVENTHYKDVIVVCFGEPKYEDMGL
jgi:hypothetical protein